MMNWLLKKIGLKKLKNIQTETKITPEIKPRNLGKKTTVMRKSMQKRRERKGIDKSISERSSKANR